MYTALYSKMANAHWPLAPVANGHWPLLLYKSYTCYTHGVKAFQSYTALKRYTVYITIQLYIAIHYTTSTSPLWQAAAAMHVQKVARGRLARQLLGQHFVRGRPFELRRRRSSFGEDTELSQMSRAAAELERATLAERTRRTSREDMSPVAPYVYPIHIRVSPKPG